MPDETVRLTLVANSTGSTTFKGFLLHVHERIFFNVNNFLGYLVMAFDNSLGDAAQPIGMFRETVSGTPVITPGKYLDCYNGVKVLHFSRKFLPNFVIEQN